MKRRIEAVAAGIRMLNTELYGSHGIAEELVMERARNIVQALITLEEEERKEESR